MSVANIYSEQIYDEVTLLPKLNAVNDPRMGVMTKHSTCLTFFGNLMDCPNHFVHIKLQKPVYHVGHIDNVRRNFKVVNHNCFRILIDSPQEKEKIGKIQYSQQRFLKSLNLLNNLFAESVTLPTKVVAQANRSIQGQGRAFKFSLNSSKIKMKKVI